MKTRSIIYVTALVVAVLIVMAASLFVGPVTIPAKAVADILVGHGDVSPAWHFIVLEARLPQMLVAALAGAALATCGLLLQNLFGNPLADPSVFGISSGASLGVALVMLVWGGGAAMGSLVGVGAVVGAAFIGAMAVTAVVLACSMVVRGRAALLIVGLMIGYLASAAITVLNYFAAEDGVKQYLLWGMGSFTGVSPAQLPLLAVPVVAALVAALLMSKQLDLLQLGPQYAASLGVNVQRCRLMVLALTGILTAVTTAFCGPVAFIGLAVPHMARMVVNTDRHLLLLPVSMLTGALVAILCNVGCSLPGAGGVLPVNAVTPLVGAPVVIYVMMKR